MNAPLQRDIALEARFKTLMDQRDSALNTIVLHGGEIAYLKDQLEKAQARIQELESKDPHGG